MGFLETTYTSDASGAASVDFSTPADAYVLLIADEAADGMISVENRCIVAHAADATKTRIGIGKIVCTNGVCTAAMGEYPEPSTTTTTTTSTVTLAAGMMTSVAGMAVAVAAVLW